MSAPAAVRTRIGKYEIGKTLGEGTFAKVKYGKHVETGVGVAIKIIDKDKILKHKMVEQVHPSAQMLVVSLALFSPWVLCVPFFLLSHMPRRKSVQVCLISTLSSVSTYGVLDRFGMANLSQPFFSSIPVINQWYKLYMCIEMSG
jgi:serine/threonine protein kinase